MVQTTTIDRFASPVAKPARPSVMLIEDNASLRDSLGDFLEEEGYEVDKCADLAEALVLLGVGLHARADRGGRCGRPGRGLAVATAWCARCADGPCALVALSVGWSVP